MPADCRVNRLDLRWAQNGRWTTLMHVGLYQSDTICERQTSMCNAPDQLSVMERLYATQRLRSLSFSFFRSCDMPR